MGKELKLSVDGKEISKKEIKARFDRYNEQYFDGKLGNCRFFWLISGVGFNGKYTEKTTADGKVLSKIGINRGVQWTEETLRELLVHEMIHMYVSTIEGVEHDGFIDHGKHFKAQCERIKNDYGLDIRPHGGLGRTNKKLSLKFWEKVLLWLFDR